MIKTVTPNKDRVEAELARFAGNLISAEIHLAAAAQAVRAMSVYNPAWPIDRTRLEPFDVSRVRLSQQKRDVWLADLFWSFLAEALPASDQPWIIGGDFNLSETFDDWQISPTGNREYLERMANLGLVECLRTSRGELTPTFLNTDGVTVKHQMDHLFVSPALADSLISCNVGNQAEVFGQRLSDHLPLIADFHTEPPN